MGCGEVDELAVEDESGVQIHTLAVSLLVIIRWETDRLSSEPERRITCTLSSLLQSIPTFTCLLPDGPALAGGLPRGNGLSICLGIFFLVTLLLWGGVEICVGIMSSGNENEHHDMIVASFGLVPAELSAIYLSLLIL
jgi:hypothetical protein